MVDERVVEVVVVKVRFVKEKRDIRRPSKRSEVFGDMYGGT